MMTATVAVIGGGYGGIAAAQALDDAADVVLVEPRDKFVHNVAALRGLVDPAWTDRLFFGYGRLLDRGRVMRDRAVRVDAGGVTLGSGARLDADYLVLATGSAYPFPAKVDVDDSDAARDKLRAGHEALAAADSVLLLGAGPVGLELAGEIRAAWPEMAVTIVDPADDIMSGGFVPELRAELRRQLDALGVELVLGTRLRQQPPVDAGEVKTFTVSTTSGRQITADIWFRCFGVEPATDYLAADLAAARRPDGYLDVTTELRLPGHRHVFAIGDITAIPEPKMAKAAGQHAEVVAANIRTLIAGGNDLTGYRAAEPAIALPLGPTGGASYAPGVGLLGAAQTAQIKGTHLRVDVYAELFGG